MIAIGTPTIAPITVRLTITPTMINIRPSTMATKRPVNPTMTAINRQSATKGHRNQGI